MKLLLLVLTLLSVASLTLFHPSSARDQEQQPVGGWSPIKNITDPYVTEIGGYAVTEHNKAAGDSLVFGKVIKGEQQVVAGVNYNLTLDAEDGKGMVGKYQAVVYDREWDRFRQLSFFSPV